MTLTDERWVAPTDPASNAASVQATLLTGRAAAARFVPLYTGDPTPGAGSVLVLFSGEAKRRVFETARGAGPVEAMPIRALLRNPTTPVEVFCT